MTQIMRSQQNFLGYQIRYLARELGSLPSADGVQQKWLVVIMVALLEHGIAFDALLCALEDAVQEVDA